MLIAPAALRPFIIRNGALFTGQAFIDQGFALPEPQIRKSPNLIEPTSQTPREDPKSRSPNLGPYTTKGRDLLFGSSRGSGIGLYHYTSAAISFTKPA